MEKALIVTGGQIGQKFCMEYLKKHSFDYMAAVDLGLRFFYDAGIVPDLAVGDFDSADAKVLHYFEEKKGIEWIRLVPEKDDTDTEAAVRRVAAKGYGQIHILGATGSRLDHALGNIGLLGIGFETGTEIFLADPHNRVRMIKEPLVISKKEQFGEYVSVLPVSEKVCGVTLIGMKYPLFDYTMTQFNSLGISNEIIEERAEIRMKSGTLLVLETKD